MGSISKSRVRVLLWVVKIPGVIVVVVIIREILLLLLIVSLTLTVRVGVVLGDVLAVVTAIGVMKKWSNNR